MRPEDLSCPTCGARNLEITKFDKPVLILDKETELRYVQATWYCTVCSKDGMITSTKKVPE